jgi:predicted N-acetyltransferase YhbS
LDVVRSALIHAAIGAATVDQCPALFLEGDPKYYGRRGFERGPFWELDCVGLRDPRLSEVESQLQ